MIKTRLGLKCVLSVMCASAAVGGNGVPYKYRGFYEFTVDSVAFAEQRPFSSEKYDESLENPKQ